MFRWLRRALQRPAAAEAAEAVVAAVAAVAAAAAAAAETVVAAALRPRPLPLPLPLPPLCCRPCRGCRRLIWGVRCGWWIRERRGRNYGVMYLH